MALYGIKWGFADYNRSNAKRKVKKKSKKVLTDTRINDNITELSAMATK